MKTQNNTLIRTLCIAFFLCLGIGAGCGSQKDAIPVADGLVTAPHQRLTNATLQFYEHGVKRWLLDTDYMERPLADSGRIVVVPVRISMYDSVGNLTTKIYADSGTSNLDMSIFDLWGSVDIRNEDGMVVNSEQLKWYKDDRLITSETYVQVETAKGDILRGKGLDAVDDFSRFSFSSDVSGMFPDFRERLEEQDEDFF